MRHRFFTLLLLLIGIFAYAQDASDFGPNDVLIANFETVSPILTDSLWMDTLKTTPVTVQSANIVLAENPFPLENTSETAALYTRPAGGWRAIHLRFDRSIALSKTPYLQVQIYPVAGKSPSKSSIGILLMNDLGEVKSIGGWQGNLPQDEWSTVSVFLGKQKSSVKFNAIRIEINNGDSVATNEETEYYIDQIGFKTTADGVELPATVFFESFGDWNNDWQNGTVPGQIRGEMGTASSYHSIGGFTSGIPWTFRDIEADTVATLVARTWGMSAKYEGATGGGRIQLKPSIVGTLESGDIDVAGFTDLNLSFGIGTQTWWPYNSNIANARPQIDISVNGGAFYEIYSDSEFLQFTGEQVDLGWGPMDKYEDQIFTKVEYPFTNIEGAPLPAISTVNLRMSYKSGNEFWIDDMWLSGKYTESGRNDLNRSDKLSFYPNPAKDFIVAPNAQEITVLDLTGKMHISAKNVEKVSVADLASGVYIVRIVGNNTTSVSKMTKL